jgi:hypothetical protein
MHERLVPLVLTAARELAECVESGEHPLAAVAAVCRCTEESLGLGLFGRADPEWHYRLVEIRGGVERAVGEYGIDPERAATTLRNELRRLEPLRKLAQAVRDAERATEECFA